MPLHDKIHEFWKPIVKAYIKRQSGEDRERLQVKDFPSGQSVQINFEDGSTAIFHYAFYLTDKSGHRVMVFTEHCGYFEFPPRSIASIDICKMVSRRMFLNDLS